jgi:hypothetical protein
MLTEDFSWVNGGRGKPPLLSSRALAKEKNLEEDEERKKV